MATFIIAFTVAMFCAWHMNDAGYPEMGILLAAFIGIVSGAFVAHAARRDNGKD